ncbi:MAG TPA: PIG-L family deacetylase [Candidatus Acidoferrum sp.]|nr:PIG-L family deacetylase [Candidatus Acidoferrum sp.]
MNRLLQRLVGSFLFAILLESLWVQPASPQFAPAPGTGPGLPETMEAIDSARVTTRILYITAHPDDESATLLTYLARGLHADVALLTLTRGEGGQNDLGPEQAPQLGLIRTQELLAATRGYGVKLFFANAPDFGFSKTPEETEKVWGQSVLGEMVRVIRTFRPNIVINGWGGVHGGHGHHQTSGLWTPIAVEQAADPKAFPEQIREGLRAWGGSSNPVQLLGTERGGATADPNGVSLPVDEISPLWGKTWREIGLDAFANHRSQGITNFIGSPFLRRPVVLILENGGKLDASSLAGNLEQWANSAAQTLCGQGKTEGCKVMGAAKADGKILAARKSALNLDWKNAMAQLAGAATLIVSISPPDSANGFAGYTSDQAFDLRETKERLDRALALVAGLDLKADADREMLVVGESFGVHAEARCRKEDGCELGPLLLNLPPEFKETKSEGDAEKGYQFTVAVTQPPPPLTAWQNLFPEPPPLLRAEQNVSIDGYRFKAELPVTHISANSTRLDRVPLRIVPAYTLAVDPKQAIAIHGKQEKPFAVLLRVHSYATKPAKLTVGLDLPHGFSASAPEEISIDGSGDRYAKLTVTAPNGLAPGNYPITAYAKRGDEKFSTSLEPLPSLPTQLWSEPAQCLVHALAINVPENLRVGYITAEGEPIPQALRMLGIQVETLDAQALAFGDLSIFNSIVVGVRAYELRPELAGANQRLLDYVSKGGTLVVQYNRDFAWNKEQFAPYPAKILNEQGHLPRITDENSPVIFLRPDDPLLNRPNKITQDDFKGWVQERGLYYWTQFDSKYTPLLAMNDPGEPDLNGALIYTRYGKGMYIYTGIAFFRQIPEGVPGAYRLFVNLLSATQQN